MLIPILQVKMYKYTCMPGVIVVNVAQARTCICGGRSSMQGLNPGDKQREFFCSIFGAYFCSLINTRAGNASLFWGKPNAVKQEPTSSACKLNKVLPCSSCAVQLKQSNLILGAMCISADCCAWTFLIACERSACLRDA